MDCNEFRMMVQVFVDGEFDEMESAEARLHLRGCAECRSLAEHHANMRDHFRDAYASEAAPDDFKLRLMARLRAHAEALDRVSVEDASLEGASEPPQRPEVLAFRRAAPAAAAVRAISAPTQADSANVVTLDFAERAPVGAPGDPDASAEPETPVELTARSVEAHAFTEAPTGEPSLAADPDAATPRAWWVGAGAVAAVTIAVFALSVAGTSEDEPAVSPGPLGGVEQAMGGAEAQAEEFYNPPLKPTVVQARDYRPIVVESVNWHRRNLPPEVVGPSGERVSTWLKPKVDFPVRLPRFERTGREDVNLLGARLSNVRDKQAAYVVYEVDGNKISVMLIGGNRIMAQPRRARVRRRPVNPPIYTANGYNVAVIQDNGITYSVTSELPREDMAQLVDAAFAR